MHQHRSAFVCKRIAFSTPLAAIQLALTQQGNKGMLLTADHTGCNGDFTAIRPNSDGRFYMYDLMCTTVTELTAAYLFHLTHVQESRYAMLLLETQDPHANHITSSHGLDTLMAPHVLRDAMGSTSPWEHDHYMSIPAAGERLLSPHCNQQCTWQNCCESPGPSALKGAGYIRTPHWCRR